MRNFFINSLNLLIGVFLIFMTVAVLAAVATAFAGGYTTPDGQQVGGALMGVGILIAGALYIMFIGGFMYLGLGIYYNTKRMADALEAQSRS